MTHKKQDAPARTGASTPTENASCHHNNQKDYTLFESMLQPGEIC